MRGVLVLLSLLFACEQGDPTPTPTLDASVDAEPSDAEAPYDAPIDDAAPDAGPGCAHAETDYVPDLSSRNAALWPACISDDGEYHRIESTISSIARVEAFDRIKALLFDATNDPAAADFESARLIYLEAEGLESRISRRADWHYPAPATGTCRDPGVPEANPEYCVGPAILAPILNDAFIRGGASEAPTRVQAARIEAALIWFLYVSPYSETLSCTTTPRDCDSAYAYYTGGAPAREGIGLATYVRAIDPLAHERAWDAILGVRCWRNLDHETTTATDLVMRDRVLAQYDHALIDGVAAIVRNRTAHTGATAGLEQQAHWTFVRTLGASLDREATTRSAPQAEELRRALTETDATVADVAAVETALDALFDCP